MLPPVFLRLRIQDDKRRIRLWIPLIVLWPLIAVVLLLGDACCSTSSSALGTPPARSFRPAGRTLASLRACLAARPALQRNLRRGPRIHFN